MLTQLMCTVLSTLLLIDLLLWWRELYLSLSLHCAITVTATVVTAVADAAAAADPV